MKYKYSLILFTLFFASMFFTSVQAQQKKYEIKGHIENISAPAKAYLYYNIDDNYEVDSCLVSNGKFTFSGTTEYPFFAQLAVKTSDNLENIAFYVDPGTVYIQGKGSLSNAQITGGPTNNLHNQFKKSIEPISLESQKLQVAYQNATEQERNSQQFKDSLNKRYKELTGMYNNTALNFISNHPNSMLGIYMLMSELRVHPNNTGVEIAYNRLSEEIRNSKPGKQLAALINKYKPLSIGDTAPDFTINDIDDKPVSLSDYRGKYVLLVFWSPECDHCKIEIPHISSIYDQTGNKNFEVVAIAVENEDNKQNWKDMVANLNLKWINLSELALWQGKTTADYKIIGVPYNYLIDPQGKIIATELYGATLENTLSKLLK